MATKRNRVRKSQKSRKIKSRKGGILGIHATKTEADNIRNCETYWNPTDKGRCTKERSYSFDYPGFFRQKSGEPVRAKNKFNDHATGKVYRVGEEIPKEFY